METAAQIISIVAMVFNILSYQQKSRKGIIAVQFVGGTLFAISFLMLGAYSGGLLNVVGAVRAILFYNRDKFRMDKPVWLVIFFAIYLACYAMTFVVFKTEPTPFNFAIEILPVIGLVATTFAYRHTQAKVLRRFSLISSVSWLIYNFVAMSVGAICCEILSLASIIIAMLRFDIKKEK